MAEAYRPTGLPQTSLELPGQGILQLFKLYEIKLLVNKQIHLVLLIFNNLNKIKNE